jgi:hypothetical protein
MTLLSKVLWPGHIIAGRVDRTRFYTEIGAGVSSTGYEPYPAHDRSGRRLGKACDWGPPTHPNSRFTIKSVNLVETPR